MTKSSNPKFKAAKALLDNKDISSISQLVRKKHLSIAEMAAVMGKSPGYPQKCLADPGRFRIEDLAAIAAFFDLTKEYVIRMALADYTKKNPGQ